MTMRGVDADSAPTCCVHQFGAIYELIYQSIDVGMCHGFGTAE